MYSIIWICKDFINNFKAYTFRINLINSLIFPLPFEIKREQIQYITNKNYNLSKKDKSKTLFRKIDYLYRKWYNIAYERKSIRNNKKI